MDQIHIMNFCQRVDYWLHHLQRLLSREFSSILFQIGFQGYSVDIFHYDICGMIFLEEIFN